MTLSAAALLGWSDKCVYVHERALRRERPPMPLPEDLERIHAAEAKRARRAAKRAQR